jgi:hypothetical protein
MRLSSAMLRANWLLLAPGDFSHGGGLAREAVTPSGAAPGRTHGGFS